MKYFFLLFIILFGSLGCSIDVENKNTKTAVKPIVVSETNDHIIISQSDQLVLRYQKVKTKPLFDVPDYYHRSGFIHPVYTPKGTIISDDFPVGHTHQHAFFHAWTNTTFRGEKVDFWNQQNQLGDIEHKEVLELNQTDSTAGFKIALEHLSLKHGPILHEDWTITAFKRDNYYLWEIALEQQNGSSDTLFINDYHYGGLGFRASKHWNETDSSAFQNPMRILTSQGLQRDSSNHSRPEWISAFATINDSLVGLAVLDHPDNFRYPQPVRVHPEMPYFCKAPMVGQAFNLPPMGSYKARYRVLVFDGAPDKQIITREQKHFAKH